MQPLDRMWWCAGRAIIFASERPLHDMPIAVQQEKDGRVDEEGKAIIERALSEVSPLRDCSSTSNPTQDAHRRDSMRESRGTARSY
jgi:hypothetical protein